MIKKKRRRDQVVKEKEMKKMKMELREFVRGERK